MSELPKELTRSYVKGLRELEESQTEEWAQLYASLSPSQKLAYAKIKGELQREEATLERRKWSFDQWKQHEYSVRNLVATRDSMLAVEDNLEEMIHKRLAKLGEENESFSFFWETKSPFSQWHPSVFTAPSYLWKNDFARELVRHGFPAERVFTTAEQWMMYCKAMVFLDLEIADEIMTTSDPRQIKELGRQVRRFNEDTWNAFRWTIVYLGNKHKFTQDSRLRYALLETAGTTLVEASPYDKIWGIGLRESDLDAQHRSTWNGKNLLGEILTELRVKLMGSYRG